MFVPVFYICRGSLRPRTLRPHVPLLEHLEVHVPLDQTYRCRHWQHTTHALRTTYSHQNISSFKNLADLAPTIQVNIHPTWTLGTS